MSIRVDIMPFNRVFKTMKNVFTILKQAYLNRKKNKPNKIYLMSLK